MRRSDAPNGAHEQYCAYGGGARGGVLYRHRSAGWTSLRRAQFYGGDARAAGRIFDTCRSHCSALTPQLNLSADR